MSSCCAPDATSQRQRRLLWIVLILNGAMFVVEFAAGLIAQSSGLLADSLDMLADALVYAVSLYAVGKALIYKARAAMLNGTLQLGLGILVLIDVIRHMVFGASPDAQIMFGVATLALVINVTCFVMLYQFRDGDINMRASWICSRNDMLANTGVLVSAALVGVTNSAWPDWIIGLLIAFTIIVSSIGIIRAARKDLKGEPSTPSQCCS